MKSTAQRQFTGWHMLAVITAFFAVIIGVNVTMAVSAIRTWTGLVVENSYVESQLFNEKQAIIAAQKAAGWTVETRYEDGGIAFSGRDGEGKLLALEDVSAFIHRPVGGRDDTTIALERDGNRYAGAVTLAPGVWDVTVTTADTSLGPIVYETRVVVK